MSTDNVFRVRKYCLFNGSSYHPGDENNMGDGITIDDSGVFMELAKGRHPHLNVKGKTLDGKPFKRPISGLFCHFLPETLSETVEPYVKAFMKGESFEDMLKAEAKTLKIDTADMGVNALRIAIMMKKAKANPDENAPDDLSKLTKAKLIDKAAELEIEDFDKLKTKTDLIDAIEAKIIENAE